MRKFLDRIKPGDPGTGHLTGSEGGREAGQSSLSCSYRTNGQTRPTDADHFAEGESGDSTRNSPVRLGPACRGAFPGGGSCATRGPDQRSCYCSRKRRPRDCGAFSTVGVGAMFADAIGARVDRVRGRPADSGPRDRKGRRASSHDRSSLRWSPRFGSWPGRKVFHSKQ